jgi:hypothetical protein
MSGPRGLKELQEAFARAITADGEEAMIVRLTDAPAVGRQRLAVYRHAVLANATQALEAAFPVVARLVGDAYFAEAAARHLGQEPPTSGDLNRYGAGFPAFLDAYRHAAGMPWLPDVARLEWAWHDALMAADAAGLDLAALASVPETHRGGIRFLLHPSVRLVRSAWPVLAIWEANQPDRDGTPDRDAGSDDVLLWRADARVRAVLLAPAEASFLERLAARLTLEEAADLDGPWDLPGALRRFAAHGVLCGFSVDR